MNELCLHCSLVFFFVSFVNYVLCMFLFFAQLTIKGLDLSEGEAFALLEDMFGGLLPPPTLEKVFACSGEDLEEVRTRKTIQVRIGAIHEY